MNALYLFLVFCFVYTQNNNNNNNNIIINYYYYIIIIILLLLLIINYYYLPKHGIYNLKLITIYLYFNCIYNNHSSIF